MFAQDPAPWRQKTVAAGIIQYLCKNRTKTVITEIISSLYTVNTETMYTMMSKHFTEKMGISYSALKERKLRQRRLGALLSICYLDCGRAGFIKGLSVIPVQ